MTRRDVPEPWATAMVRAGITDPRNDKRPSMNQLAQATGVHTTTISSMLWGDRETDQGTLDRVAEVLRIKPSLVAEWAGRVRAEEAPYEPPAVASLMTQDQRNLVDGIIRQFTAAAVRTQPATPTVNVTAQAERPKTTKQLQRQLERARATRDELAHTGSADDAPTIAALNDTIRRLEEALSTSPVDRSAEVG